jgi:hypothetical protein
VAGSRSFTRDNDAAFHDFARRGRGRRQQGVGALLPHRVEDRPLASTLGSAIGFLHRSPLSLEAAPAMNCADVANEAEPPTGDANSSVGASLLVRLRAGQAGAWERLVRLYGQTVYVWCRGAGVSEADAADVSQEVFAAVARHITEFRRERPGDSFRGWLWTITLKGSSRARESSAPSARIRWLAHLDPRRRIRTTEPEPSHRGR